MVAEISFEFHERNQQGAAMFGANWDNVQFVSFANDVGKYVNCDI